VATRELVDTTSIQTLTNKLVTAIGSTAPTALESRFAREYWVDDFGDFTPNGGSSATNSTTLQTAINYVGGTVLGGRLKHKAGRYDLSVPLVNIYNNVLLDGAGAGSNRDGDDDSGSAATIWKWTGSAGATLYDLGPAIGADHNVTGGGIVGIFLDGNKLAGTAFKIRSVRGGLFNMVLAETTGYAMDMQTEETVVLDPPSTQSCWFEAINIIQLDAAAGGCMRMDGPDTAGGGDVSECHFGRIRLLHRNNTALDMFKADNNVFGDVTIFRHPSGTATGVIFHAGSGTRYVRENVIVYLQANAGGLISQGFASGAVPAKDNHIITYSNSNGTPDPIIELGSTLNFQKSNGKCRLMLEAQAPVNTLMRSTNSAGDQLGDFSWGGYDSASAEKTYVFLRAIQATTTAGVEDGTLRVVTKNAGTDTIQTQFKDGVMIGDPSGTFKGVGTINMQNSLFQSTTNGAFWERAEASELLTLSTSGTTTNTSANLLPADSVIEAVVARVTTTITTATDWTVGDPTTPARFAAANSTMTAGTTSVGTVHVDQTGAAGPRQTANAKVRITTTGTPGAGVIRITVFYRKFRAPTS